MKKWIVMFVVAVLMATPAFAQEEKKGERRGPRGEFFQKLEKDGAIKIADCKDEKQVEFLKKIDADNDGTVTKEEFNAFREKMKAEWEAKKGEGKKDDAKKGEGKKERPEGKKGEGKKGEFKKGEGKKDRPEAKKGEGKKERPEGKKDGKKKGEGKKKGDAKKGDCEKGECPKEEKKD